MNEIWSGIWLYGQIMAGVVVSRIFHSPIIARAQKGFLTKVILFACFPQKGEL